MEAHSVKVVDTRTSSKIDNEMGRSMPRNVVLDDSYKLNKLFGGPAIDVEILKSTNSQMTFRREDTRYRTINTPCRYSSFLDDFAFPWLAIRGSLLGFFGLDFDDYTSGIA